MKIEGVKEGVAREGNLGEGQCFPGLNFSARLLMQNLWPVGPGPSGNTWPRWASHCKGERPQSFLHWDKALYVKLDRWTPRGRPTCVWHLWGGKVYCIRIWLGSERMQSTGVVNSFLLHQWEGEQVSELRSWFTHLSNGNHYTYLIEPLWWLIAIL